ncbi:Zn(II)2Cys6 transcription factor [Sporobolomyces koalae]|uniref:Zn(II)2Cys6 transcription factor n=1 Tax=Sporobolomyces koalae TaxID=500713 RepID=UPI003170DA9B
MDASDSATPSAGVGDDGDFEFAPPAPVASSSRKKGNTKRGASVLGGEDDDDNKKKRNRKPVTCAQCRRRKLKCDRGYPCGACRDRQEGHLCEWEGAIRLPQPHLTRDAEAAELRGQLDRFETLLGALTSGNPITISAEAAARAADPASHSNVPNPNVSQTPSHLAANSSTAKVANSTARAQLLAHAQSVGHLVGLLPSRRELDILVTRFLTSEINFLPVTHVPSFQERYNAFSHSTASEDPFLLAFLFSIVSYEMGWQITDSEMSKNAGIQKEGAMKRLYEAASEVLRMAGHLESPNLDVVRTLIVLYHSAVQQLDGRASFVLTQAIQVAQTLGLNRDPKRVGITNPIDMEERRRLWYILVAFDSLERPARLSTISSEEYDTEFPASAFDHEITDAGVKTRPFPTFTPALYLELIQNIGNYNNLIVQSFFAIKPKEPITWAKIAESNDGLDRLKASFPPLSWKNGLVEPLTEENFASDRFRVLAHTMLLKLDIQVNKPFLTRGYVDPRFAQGRNRVLDSAHQLLGIWLAYPDQSQVSRLWQLTFHGLNALCIIVLDLYQDPKGPRSDSHRKFLAMSSGRLDRPEFKSKISQEVTRIVSILAKHFNVVPAAYVPPETPLDLNEKFTVTSLPRPLTQDVHKHVGSSLTDAETDDVELVTLWHEMVSTFPSMYAVPDRTEWHELCKKDNRWNTGIDLVSHATEAIDLEDDE